MDKPIDQIRVEYHERGLLELDAASDPILQFDRWFDDATREGLREPNAMSLATVDADGRPSVRIVLLKGYSAQGFIFYTNYSSRKGREIAANARVAACIWWEELARQVRIEGTAERISADRSSQYFASRPRTSQLGAHASPQSEVISGRAALERNLAQLEARYAAGEVPRPEHWGGYVIVPDRIEFWQGRERRLHDRLVYSRIDEHAWKRERLAP